MKRASHGTSGYSGGRRTKNVAQGDGARAHRPVAVRLRKGDAFQSTAAQQSTGPIEADVKQKKRRKARTPRRAPESRSSGGPPDLSVLEANASALTGEPNTNERDRPCSGQENVDGQHSQSACSELGAKSRTSPAHSERGEKATEPASDQEVHASPDEVSSTPIANDDSVLEGKSGDASSVRNGPCGERVAGKDECSTGQMTKPAFRPAPPAPGQGAGSPLGKIVSYSSNGENVGLSERPNAGPVSHAHSVGHTTRGEPAPCPGAGGAGRKAVGHSAFAADAPPPPWQTEEDWCRTCRRLVDCGLRKGGVYCDDARQVVSGFKRAPMRAVDVMPERPLSAAIDRMCAWLEHAELTSDQQKICELLLNKLRYCAAAVQNAQLRKAWNQRPGDAS